MRRMLVLIIDEECTQHRSINVNIRSEVERDDEGEAGGVADDEVDNEGANGSNDFGVV